jgi:hypothetical protein
MPFTAEQIGRILEMRIQGATFKTIGEELGCTAVDVRQSVPTHSDRFSPHDIKQYVLRGLRINKVYISTHEAKLNSSSLHEKLLAPS